MRENNYNFTPMMWQRQIVFKMIFFLGLISTTGPDTYSKSILMESVEIKSCPGNGGNSFSLDFDSADEDQIDQSYIFNLTFVPLVRFIIPLKIFTVRNFCYSVWQPPKVY